LSGTGEPLCVNELVENKSKRTKLAESTPSDPIKTTRPLNKLQIKRVAAETKEVSANFVKLNKNPTPPEEYRGVTAVMAVATAGPKPGRPGRRCTSNNIIKVLLDSGSDGDLWFHEKGTPKHFPYLTRQVPKTWHTSNGDFHTKWKGDIQLKFFQYSSSKKVHVQPDVVEYDGVTLEKPLFDLILGTKTMDELGIILNFKERVITIDEIDLPMQSIEHMPTSRKKAIALNHSLANLMEPRSTEEETNRVVRILDANYKKADLQAVVKDNCTHLSSTEQKMLLKLLTDFDHSSMEL